MKAEELQAIEALASTFPNHAFFNSLPFGTPGVVAGRDVATLAHHHVPDLIAAVRERDADLAALQAKVKQLEAAAEEKAYWFNGPAGGQNVFVNILRGWDEARMVWLRDALIARTPQLDNRDTPSNCSSEA